MGSGSRLYRSAFQQKQVLLSETPLILCIKSKVKFNTATNVDIIHIMKSPLKKRSMIVTKTNLTPNYASAIQAASKINQIRRRPDSPQQDERVAAHKC